MYFGPCGFIIVISKDSKPLIWKKVEKTDIFDKDVSVKVYQRVSCSFSIYIDGKEWKMVISITLCEW